MQGVLFLDENDDQFPSPAEITLPGLAVVGSNLNPDTIIKAYRKGYFPWYNEGDPKCWFHPDPRMVLFPKELKVSKSMRTVINGNKFLFKIDNNFPRVIRSCRSIKRWNGETKSWITDEIIESYSHLFEMGVVHCAEAWQEGQMVGGLYGLRIGDIFFGESMFSTISNASKFAFILFVRYLIKQGVQLIDCQQQTHHMATLGAKPISRKKFVHYLETLIPENEDIW